MVNDEEGVQGGTPSLNKIHRNAKNQRLKKQSPIYRGVKVGWRRTSLIIREAHLHKIKDIAYWDRKKLKDVVDEALESYLKGKDITVRPHKKEV